MSRATVSSAGDTSIAAVPGSSLARELLHGEPMEELFNGRVVDVISQLFLMDSFAWPMLAALAIDHFLSRQLPRMSVPIPLWRSTTRTVSVHPSRPHLELGEAGSSIDEATLRRWLPEADSLRDTVVGCGWAIVYCRPPLLGNLSFWSRALITVRRNGRDLELRARPLVSPILPLMIFAWWYVSMVVQGGDASLDSLLLSLTAGAFLAAVTWRRYRDARSVGADYVERIASRLEQPRDVSMVAPDVAERGELETGEGEAVGAALTKQEAPAYAEHRGG